MLYEGGNEAWSVGIERLSEERSSGGRVFSAFRRAETRGLSGGGEHEGGVYGVRVREGRMS